MLRIILDCKDKKFDSKFTHDEEIVDCLAGWHTPQGLREAQKETVEHLIEIGMSGYGYLLGDYGCMITRDRSFCTNEALELFGDIVIVNYLTDEYASVRNLIANGVVKSANEIFDNLDAIEFNKYVFTDYRFDYIGRKGLSLYDDRHITIIGFDYYKNDTLICSYDTEDSGEISCVVLNRSEYIHPKFRETTNRVMWIDVKDFEKQIIKFEKQMIKTDKPNYINEPCGIIGKE